jgi:hypothetical protein
MRQYDSYATANEIEDLAPPLTIKQAAKFTKEFLKKLPNNLVDGELRDGINKENKN